jgi:hypothetical protein
MQAGGSGTSFNTASDLASPRGARIAKFTDIIRNPEKTLRTLSDCEFPVHVDVILPI